MLRTLPSIVLVFLCCATSTGASEPSDKPIAPTEVVRPFNGRDLSGLSTWLKDSGADDPGGVFSAQDGMIHVSGEGAGYLATKQAYKNYHLSIEYKWGRRKEGEKYVRNSGLLLHKIGPDRVWPTSIEVQLAQGCEGDFIVIRGQNTDSNVPPATITCEVRIADDGKTRWQKGGEKKVYAGRQFWWSKHQVGFKELIDTRGTDDVASPLGEWTKVECICNENRITVKINGETVNECFDCIPAAGQILLQNEGHEIYFRNFELRPLAAE